MNNSRRMGRGRLLLFIIFSSAVLTIAFRSTSIGAAGGAENSRLASLTATGLKFEGARSCAGSKCHESAKSADPPKPPGNELSVWADQDRHHSAYQSLTKQTGADIGKKMNLDAATSERCITCHALAVPEAQQGEKFTIKEGNSCNACHGPSQKWREPHAEAGWTDAQRKAAGGSVDALLKATGLYDTQPVVARSEICASCHLAIDADMVAAGHPQPRFELDSFTLNMPKHWREMRNGKPEGYRGAKLWAAGQVVCARDAMKQLATRAKGGAADPQLRAAYEQAMAHLAMLRQLAAAKAITADAAALDSKSDALKAAMTGGKKDDLAAQAMEVAALASTAAPSAEAFDPDANKQAVKTILANLAADASIAKDFGENGMDQHALAISALYNAYAKGEGVTEADVKAMNDTIASLFPPEKGKITADQFVAALATVKAKLPPP